MTLKRILTLFAVIILAEARRHNVQKRDISSVCDPTYNNTNNVHCYCIRDTKEPSLVRSADCYPTVGDVKPNDPSWNAFDQLKNTHKLTLTNTRGINLKYIPTNALEHTKALLKLEVKYGNIEKLQPFAFANLSFVEEIVLRDSQIQVLGSKAFAHHRDLITINLDKNNIVEINRDVFIDLPSLEKLFLVSNKITTIHDRAFVHLVNLRELEISANNLFSLNSETFSGLKKLQKLDLSSNSLEVIGDNTFLPLNSLRYLNLEGNKIQMLDERAFAGLAKLQYLSLAHNKLSVIDNVKTFDRLDALTSLSLKANEIRELKSEVMAPLMANLHAKGNLDLEDNKFPCDCRLDWLLTLMNRTLSSSLKLALENLKCYPDAKLRETWNKLEDSDRNTGQIFEDEDAAAPNTEYEYYDESQLNGRLFYIDVRHLLNCTTSGKTQVPDSNLVIETTKKPDVTTKLTKETPPTFVKTTPQYGTPKATSKPIQSEHRTKTPNHGLLDLSHFETTAKPIADSTKDAIHERNTINEEGNKINHEPKDSLYTTSRLVTVSASPIEDGNVYEEDMASDEAKPDKLKAHRSIQDEYEKPNNNINSTSKNVGCVMLISMIVFLSLLF